jgi:hypothetical protein
MPAEGRGVKKNPLCPKKAMIVYIEIPHIMNVTF